MIKYLLYFIVYCLGLSYNSVAIAQTGISAAFGHGTNSVEAYRLNLQRSWGHPCSTPKGFKVYGYWELAFTQIHGTKQFSYYTNKNLQATSLSGALRIKNIFQSPVFIDLGIGVAYMSRQKISSKDLGSNLVFEDRIGIGVLLGIKQQIELSYRATHYSNAYFARCNNGLNLHLFTLGYWFN